MSDACEARNSPDEDAAIARDALLEGDHAHALHHIAGALAGDPLRPEWLVLLDQIAADADDALALVPAEAQQWFGLAAVRARLLAAAGDVPQALRGLLAVAAVRPDLPYLAWAVEWLAADDVASRVEPRDAASGLARLAGAFTKERSPLDAYDKRRVALDHGQKIAARLLQVHPTTPELWSVRSQFLRRLGRPTEAVESARRGHGLSRNWSSAVLLALALREDARVDEAVAAYKEAIAIDPTEISTYLDLGDLLLGAKRFSEAADTYAVVLAKEAHHPWAEPSHACASLLAGAPAPGGVLARAASVLGRTKPGEEWRKRLTALARTNPRAADLLESITPGEPFVTSLPAPADATSNMVRELLAKFRGSPDELAGELGVNLSALEAPSARLAVSLQLRWLGAPTSVVYTIQKVQEPDPRAPRRPVRFLLWEYEGTDPRPAIPAPPQAICAELSPLAARPFRIDAWSAAAAEIAARLGEAACAGLMGAMVHPPAPAGPNTPAPEWIQRVQIAAALVIGRLAGRWAGSARREILLDLLDGPHDWTIGAAALALGDVAGREPEARPEIAKALHQRLRHKPRSGYVGWDYPLVCVYQRLPGLDPELAQALSRYRAAAERQWS